MLFHAIPRPQSFARCLMFLQLLTRSLGKEHPLFLVDTAGISMRFSDDVPGAREVAANVENMLQVGNTTR